MPYSVTTLESRAFELLSLKALALNSQGSSLNCQARRSSPSIGPQTSKLSHQRCQGSSFSIVDSRVTSQFLRPCRFSVFSHQRWALHIILTVNCRRWQLYSIHAARPACEESRLQFELRTSDSAYTIQSWECTACRLDATAHLKGQRTAHATTYYIGACSLQATAHDARQAYKLKLQSSKLKLKGCSAANAQPHCSREIAGKTTNASDNIQGPLVVEAEHKAQRVSSYFKASCAVSTFLPLFLHLFFTCKENWNVLSWTLCYSWYWKSFTAILWV